MMYSNKLAVALKSNGKVLREFKDTVYVPFGSEYSILIKNLNSVRAVVNITIDGDDVVPSGLVVDAGKEIDLERAIRNGNLTEGNRFKFIERTGAVEQHRGVGLEDGLIRVEFQFEVPYKPPVYNPPQWNGVYASGSTNASYNVNGVMRGVDWSKGEATKAAAASATSATLKSMNISSSTGEVHDGAATMDCYFNDVGITVPGSKSEQRFTTTTMGAMDPEKHVMIFKILGETSNNKPVIKPVTVKAKPKCTTCGKQNKATSKFCAECGTSLEIFA
jgi:zinc-ribbon domain